MKFVEICSKNKNNGEKHFSAVLFKIQPDSCVENLTGTKYNLNGITWLRKYSEMNLHSIIGRSVTVEFINDERTQILGHGDTGVEDNIPVFNNATSIGHFTDAYITEMEIDDEWCTVAVGCGVLDYMRYKPFIDILEKRLNQGDTIYGSVEIIGKPENNNNIIYLDGRKQEGRIPIDFIISGWAILDVLPSDNKSQLLELNQKNKEDIVEMNEEALKQLIVATISETNSTKEADATKIAELNSIIENKDIEINELKEAKEKAETNVSEKDEELNKLKEKCESLEKEINVCKVKELNSAFDAMLSNYTDEQKSVAISEINSYKENPLEGDADAIVSKICVAIVAKQLEDAKASELNSAKETIDIFSEINSTKVTIPEDDNIF